MPNESTSFTTKAFATDDSFFSSMDGQGSHASSANSFPVSGVQSFGIGPNPPNSIPHATYSPTAARPKEFLGGNRMDLSANFANHSNNISSNATTFPPPVRTFIPPTNNNEDLIVSNLPDLYAKFWELSFKLFFNVCSPSTSCHECLTVVEGELMVHAFSQFYSDMV